MHGKTGRAETATDPAQLDMNEITVMLKPHAQWPVHPVSRWYSKASPELFKPLLGILWPEQRRWTLDELTQGIVGGADHARFPDGGRAADPHPYRHAVDWCAHAGRDQGVRGRSGRDRTPERAAGRIAAQGARHP
ncbi:hypothetical protein LP419_37895 [Massilia sp. H-1]|nr:hypothetical protein LP419_37895 [Massilia sp. H-1]